MSNKNLKQKAASGMVWTALQKYSKMGIQFISGIILARLLTPYDYGCIGMLMIFISLAEVFIDGGFGSALIQKKRPTQTDYSTIFWWNIAVSVVMYALLYIFAPAISRFYHIPLLQDVLRVQGLVLFIYALNIIQRNQLKKKLNFKLLSIVSISTAIISLTVTILMAYNGFGVWSLVTQNLIVAAIPSIVFWFYVKWRPTWTFSWVSFKELFSFGIYVFFTHILNKVNARINGLLIGKFYDPTIMGYFSKAGSTERLASSSISQIMTQVTYPLYAEVQDNKIVMQNMIKRLTMTISYITFPLMFVLMLCAKSIFILLYSDRWLPSVPYFQMLCIAGLAYCISSVNLQTISAIGKSNVMFGWSVVKIINSISFSVCGLVLFGIKGLVMASVYSMWFVLFINICLVSKYIGYKWYKQIQDILPVGIASVIAAFVSYGCGYLLGFSLYLDGIVKFLVFIFVYLGWSFIFKPEAYNYFVSIIPFSRRKIIHKNNTNI